MNRLLIGLLALLASAISAPAQAGWTVWENLGGYLTSDPAACTAGNWTYVVVRGGDNAMYYRKRSLSTGVWAEWKRIPGTLKFVGSPSATCPEGVAQYPWSHQFQVSAVGTDNRLYRNIAFTGSSTGPYARLVDNWNGWGLESGTLLPGSGPARAPFGFLDENPNSLDIHDFVRGTDSTVFERHSNFPNGYSAWERVSGYATADPAATMQSSSWMDLIVRLQDGALWHRSWIYGVWNCCMTPVGGGVVTSSPDVVSRQPGTLDLFVRGQNYDLLHKRWTNGVWSGWTSLGGYLTSGPGATTYANKQRMMVFVRGSDGALYYKAWAP